LPAKTKATQDTVPVEVDRQALQEAFVELVGERYGYWVGRRLTQQEMATATKEQVKKVRELAKTVNTAIEAYIADASDDLRTQIINGRKTLADAKKTVKEARVPFMMKMTPLAKAVRYCDNVAIPDSLKELGHPIQPRFSLSDWVQDAIKPKK
jgi:hypothetical protein